MTRRKCFTVWLLLLAFGLPSAGGTGLHLFLPHQNRAESCCACHEHRDLPNAEHDSSGPSYVAAGEHDAECCFLCRYFTRQNLDTGQAPTVSVSTEAVRLDVVEIPFYPEISFSLHAGRSPPAEMTLV